eukprot:CAMPEP_0116142804 /NCGR_PEP_ID=MMETSP0329-20121206/15104_1 /TAXON_ID=697910 /ORGANISM="Pseudo-nitzschia arenysensis, Strain B593" /LENGTH=231 /DNA_ID=CAMNT_0003638065 /DNA_START=184 /DNA_END=879 /DNA_ORIENTATION=-
MSSYSLSPRESVSLCAKKKRRRRKTDTESSPPPPPPAAAESEVVEASPEPVLGGELPDFDLGDNGEDAQEVARAKVDPDAITANMMGRGRKPSQSLDELIMDRSLEERFEFEEKGDPSIPDFVDLASASTSTPTYSPENLGNAGVGKKKQRQAERVAKAIAAKEAAEPEESLLAKYFPQLLDEKGKFSAVKVLEQGTWACIFILVGWEFYINSPFFERAAPLAPVVFEIVM